jgi:hypothetical protein
MARYNKLILQWLSKLQRTISLSTAEAEYYAASKTAIEVIYLGNLLENMGVPQDPDSPVYEDNTACIEWGNHVIGGRERAKHIDLHKHFAHETIQNRQMCLIKVDTCKQLASLFTKALPHAQFLACIPRVQSRAAGGHINTTSAGPSDSGGGAVQLVLLDSDPKGESRRPFGGVFASKSVGRPEPTSAGVGASESGRPQAGDMHTSESSGGVPSLLRQLASRGLRVLEPLRPSLNRRNSALCLTLYIRGRADQNDLPLSILIRCCTRMMMSPAGRPGRALEQTAVHDIMERRQPGRVTHIWRPDASRRPGVGDEQRRHGTGPPSAADMMRPAPSGSVLISDLQAGPFSAGAACGSVLQCCSSAQPLPT